MKKSFLVIEVLISIFIIFLIAVTIAIAFKNINMTNDKLNYYQNNYIVVKSVVNQLINSDNIEMYNNKTIQINGFKINLKLNLVQQKRNYIVNPQGNSGNYGKFLFKLYKVTMRVKFNNYIKKYSFFLTKVVK